MKGRLIVRVGQTYDEVAAITRIPIVDNGRGQRVPGSPIVTGWTFGCNLTPLSGQYPAQLIAGAPQSRMFYNVFYGLTIGSHDPGLGGVPWFQRGDWLVISGVTYTVETALDPSSTAVERHAVVWKAA